jgi:TonB family protein
MKKALYIFLLTAAIAINAAAQTDFDEPKWTKFEPAGEEFSLDLPASPAKYREQKPDNTAGTHYLAVFNKTFFAAFSEDKDGEVLTRITLGLADEKAAPRDVEIDGIKGQRYDFKGTDDYEHSFIAIQAPVHFYIFHVISENRDNPLIEQFLASIKLNRQLAESDKPAPAQVFSAAGRNDVLKSSSAVGGGSAGIAREPGGFGNPGSGAGDAVAPPKNAKIDSSVTILSKPRPAYTDMARRYSLSGVVRLRIVFEKTGEIGNITVVMKLPLGLTQSAISAARQIKFSPALRKGERYSVSKVVEFSFQLY